MGSGICTALCFVGLMMFISTLGKTEQSASGAGMALLMVMARLGSGMMPLVFMPTWMPAFMSRFERMCQYFPY